MKIRWIFNALAAMEAVLCPGAVPYVRILRACPLDADRIFLSAAGAVLAALLFSRDKRRFIWKCAGSLCLFAALFILGAEAWLVGRCIRCVQCAVHCGIRRNEHGRRGGYFSAVDAYGFCGSYRRGYRKRRGAAFCH